MALKRGRFRVFRVGDEGGTPPPHKPGVYRCLGEGGAYTGYSAVGMAQRIADHKAKQPWWPKVVRVEYSVVHGNTSSASLQAAEAEHIERHAPTWNRQAGGGGRPRSSRRRD